MEKNNSFIQVFVTRPYTLGYLWAICELHSPNWDILSLGLTETALVSQGAVTIISSLSQNLEVLHRLTHPLKAAGCAKFSETWKRRSGRPWGQLTWQIKMGSTYQAIKSHHQAQANSHHSLPHHHHTLVRTAPLTWSDGKTGRIPSNFFWVSEGIPVKTGALKLGFCCEWGGTAACSKASPSMPLKLSAESAPQKKAMSECVVGGK